MILQIASNSIDTLQKIQATVEDSLQKNKVVETVSKLKGEEVLHFLVIVSIILIASRFLGEVFRKLKQPVVVGEILAGIIIGPSLLGTFYPDFFYDTFIADKRAFGAFDGLANIGVILLMFVAGMEVDLVMMKFERVIVVVVF